MSSTRKLKLPPMASVALQCNNGTFNDVLLLVRRKLMAARRSVVGGLRRGKVDDEDDRISEMEWADISKDDWCW